MPVTIYVSFSNEGTTIWFGIKPDCESPPPPLAFTDELCQFIVQAIRREFALTMPIVRPNRYFLEGVYPLYAKSRDKFIMALYNEVTYYALSPNEDLIIETIN